MRRAVTYKTRFRRNDPAERPPLRHVGKGGEGPTRLALMLALAHHVERSIDRGQLRGYAEAAAALGMTRARMTQVMNLLVLSPRIQEAILTCQAVGSERGLREAVKHLSWDEQTAVTEGNPEGACGGF